MTPELVAWLVAAMSAWAPPGANDAVRYDAIARDILSVALDAEEAPLFYDAKDAKADEAQARARTALVLASFAAAESGGFQVDVDTGKRRGANGAVCMMQIKVGAHGTPEGWTAMGGGMTGPGLGHRAGSSTSRRMDLCASDRRGAGR